MPEKIHEQLSEMMRAIGRLEGKLEEGFKGVQTRQDIANHRVGKLEDRVNTLESDVAVSKGKLTVIVSAITLLGSQAIEFLKDKLTN